MKAILHFIRMTLVGGVLFLVPIVVLVIVLGKALTLAHRVAGPLAQRLPVKSVIGLQTPLLLAISILVLFCFLAGFFARTAWAQKFVHRLETAVLTNLPGYEFLKCMGEGILGAESKGTYPPVLVRFDDAWQIGFRVEGLENGLVAVFIPGVPNPQSGSVFLMRADRVTPADVPPASMLKCLKRLGAGSNALLRHVSLAPAPAGEPSPFVHCSQETRNGQNQETKTKQNTPT